MKKQLSVKAQVRAGFVDPQAQLNSCQSQLAQCPSKSICLDTIQDCRDWINGCVRIGYTQDWCAGEALGKHASVPFVE